MAYYSALRQIHKCVILTRLFSSSAEQIKTAGIIVIGDEILKGETADTNSFYMSSRLHRIGVTVKKISVIGDVVNEISDEVRTFSKNYNYVITTGGIGPTHDDVTFEAVAKAFNEPLIAHPDLAAICMKFYKTTDAKAPGMKLCWVPKSSRLIYGEDKDRGIKTRYPNVAVKNVFMFPGIPQLLEGSFDLLCTTLFKSQTQFYSKSIYLKVPECTIVEVLDELVEEFPNVVFGSYPKLFNTAYKVKITIESTEKEPTVAAYKKLLKAVPKDSVVDCPEDSDYKIVDNSQNK